MKTEGSVLLCYLIPSVLLISLIQGSPIFDWLESSGNNIVNPIIIERPIDGYTLFWTEFERVPIMPEMVPYFSELMEMGIDTSMYMREQPHYYCKVIDERGSVVMAKRQINFGEFNNKSSIWLNPDELLVVSWKIADIMSSVYGLTLNILNISNGKVITTITEDINIHDCSLITDSCKNIYATMHEFGQPKYVRIYPNFGEEVEIDYHSTSIYDNGTVSFTRNNHILFCYRSNHSSQSMWELYKDWGAMPNQICYFVVDSNGSNVKGPDSFDVGEYAFHRIPDIHLGGEYGVGETKFAREDLHLASLPNGAIVLSVTGLDENDELCVYQVKFNSKGELIMPDKMEVVEARKYPEKGQLPVSKILPATIYEEYPVTGETKKRIEYVHFGFDEEGNFYSSRYLWRENIK